MDNGTGSVIVVIAFAVLIFLVCRAIVLWYWRVNDGIALLKSIDEKLGKLVTQAEDSYDSED